MTKEKNQDDALIVEGMNVEKNFVACLLPRSIQLPGKEDSARIDSRVPRRFFAQFLTL